MPSNQPWCIDCNRTPFAPTTSGCCDSGCVGRGDCCNSVSGVSEYFTKCVFPSITTLNPNRATSSASPAVVCLVSGSNFGTFLGGTSTITLNGVDVTAAVTAWSDSSISFTIPPGCGRNLYITVRNRWGNLNQALSPTFSYDAPVITATTPTTGPTTGAIALTLTGFDCGAFLPLTPLPSSLENAFFVSLSLNLLSTGTSFGPGPTTTASCTVNSLNAPVTSISHSQAIVTLPASQGAGVPVILTVCGQASAAYSFNYDPPNLVSTNPANNIRAGQQLTLTGTAFGTAGGSVTIGGIACPMVSQADTQIVCTVPIGHSTNQNIRVTVNGQQSNVIQIRYLAATTVAFFLKTLF